MASVLPKEVRRVRQQEQLSIPDLAKMSNITAQTLRKFEGTDDDLSHQVFSPSTLLKLTRVVRKLQRKIEARNNRDKAKAETARELAKAVTARELAKKFTTKKPVAKVSDDFDDEWVLEPKKDEPALRIDFGGRLVDAFIGFLENLGYGSKK